MSSKLAGMEYLEKEIAKCERRIRNIKANPDPSKPKSNYLLYEIERDLRIEQRDTYASGKPLGILGLGPLTRAMGLVPWDAIMAADRTYGPAATRYFELIRKQGMPEHACDRCSVLIPMLTEGDFPKPSFLETSNFECIPVYLAQLFVSEMLDIPRFHIDRPFENFSREMDDGALQYVKAQLEEMIEYIEATVPGCKYNEDVLVEYQEYNRQYIELFRELWQLKKTKPCPLSGRETFRELRLPDMYPDPKKAVEYMQEYVGEVREKVNQGYGAAQPEERLRFLWSVAGPFYADPFKWLEERGVSVPAAEMTIYNGWYSGLDAIWGDPWNGRKLTPLEEEARQMDFTWGRLGEPWVETHINSCKEQDLDGIVYFLQWGCPTSNCLGKVVADTAEKELGIPTLLIEGRMLESSIFDEQDFYAKLEDFIEVCLERKKSKA